MHGPSTRTESKQHHSAPMQSRVTSHAAAYYYTSSYLNITLWGKVISQLPILNTSFISKQCNFVGHIWAPAVAAPQPLEVNRSSTFWSDDI